MARAQHKNSQGGAARKGRPALLLIPLIICDAVLVAGMCYGLLQSVGYYPEQGLTTFTLDYYALVLSNPELMSSITLSLYVTLVSLVISVISAVLLSYFLVTTKHDRGIIFTILRIPMLIPWTVTAFLVMDLFGGAGILTSIASSLGFENVADLLSNMLYTPASIGIIIAYCWSTIPFILYFISPVISNISESLGEAAASMGASSWQTFTQVVLPLCKPSIRNASIFAMVGIFGGYEIPLILGMTVPRLLPVEIYTDYGIFPLIRRPEIMALCVIMIALSIVILLVIYLLFSKVGRRADTERGASDA